MKTKPTVHLLFVCVSNRVRSPFAEFFFQKMMSQRGGRLKNRVKVSSAGFISNKMKDFIAQSHTVSPDPFFGRPMAETTHTALVSHDIVVPADWESKELGPEMVKDADLIITARPDQKEALVILYPDSLARIFSIREISKWNEYLFSEDFRTVPADKNFWDYAEEDPDYVSKVLAETQKLLVRAFPYILDQLGLEVWEKSEERVSETQEYLI
jgi:protein-tyrosine-phosphatase